MLVAGHAYRPKRLQRLRCITFQVWRELDFAVAKALQRLAKVLPAVFPNFNK